MSSFDMVRGARNVVKWYQWKIANLIAIIKFLLWEGRSHSISYMGTPFPCVPAPLYTTGCVTRKF